jgi:hypothetical protein
VPLLSRSAARDPGRRTLPLIGVFSYCPAVCSLIGGSYQWNGFTAPVYGRLSQFRQYLQSPDFGIPQPPQTYDVTSLPVRGENVGAIVVDGWHAGFVGFDAKRAGAHYGRAPELLALILENCVLDVCA